jgi:phosphoglucosamine mutase
MSNERFFGTDGIRGVANDKLTADLALRLGMAVGYWIHQHPDTASCTEGRPRVIVGRDTRLSGDMLEAALAAGLAAMGADVVNVGVVPTPAVSQIVLSRRAAAGVVISASHNPFEDNGIKFFGRNGKKLPDSVEDEITGYYHSTESLSRAGANDIGRVVVTREPVRDYVERVQQTLGGVTVEPLGGLHLVMDCANGAAFELAPEIYRGLGAKLTLLHHTPNGVNINVECGSTRPNDMAAKVKEVGASAGLAFDGDADRVMLADENGEIVDGDRMMAIIGLHLHRQGRLDNNVVVATIMSNVGLEKALEAEGVRLHRTDVGDRYVGEGMDQLGAVLGGEQSGHILLPQVTPTGDGLTTALQVLTVVHETGKTLSELASVVRSYPQLLKNVKVRSKQGWNTDPDILAAVERGRARFSNPSWLSVRPSGTEQKIRVMAQGTDERVVTETVEEICAVVAQKLGTV